MSFLTKQYNIAYGTELYTKAEIFYRMLEGRGKAGRGFFKDDEEEMLRYEAELDLADSEFWKLANEMVAHVYGETLQGKWKLTKSDINYSILEVLTS